MEKQFGSVRKRIEELQRRSISEMNQEAVATSLYEVGRAMKAIETLSERQANELKLPAFLDIFIKVYYAALRVNGNSNDKSKAPSCENYMGYVQSSALRVLSEAIFLYPKLSNPFYKKNIALYLLNILAGRFCEPEDTSPKDLNLVDADNCMTTILTAMGHEPGVCEQVQQHFGVEIIKEFFANKREMVALNAITLCAFITADPATAEFEIPDRILIYLLSQLKRRLFGIQFEDKDCRSPASALLSRLQRLILCSDDFNERVMQHQVLTVLAAILAAPEPPGAADADIYWHSEVAGTQDAHDSTFFSVAFSTFVEKEWAARVCWALLLSERHFRRNAHAMRKHKKLMVALKKTAKKSERVQAVTSGVLWQLKRRQNTDETDRAPSAEERKRNGQEQLRLNRKKVASAKIAASPAVQTSEKIEKPIPSGKRDKSMPVTFNTQDEIHVTKSSHDKQVRLKSAHETTESNAESVKPQVMISYTSHCKPQLVARINKALQKAGLSTWIYTEKMSGDMYTAMAKAIEQSAVVLVCYSNAYYNSDPCHSEFNYARYCKKPIVLVRLEDFTPFGWLGISIAGKLYHDFASLELCDDKDGFDDRMSKLVAELSSYTTTVHAT